MRLTLRTLLAYRDGVLSPQVHEDLHKRLQQKPHIANLLQHINELVRSTDVLSPKLDLNGPGELNVVAEYLDDVLTSNKVNELERLCLERPDHLCELAHCHQLLAEALNTRVVVPESLQDTAYSLADAESRTLVRNHLLNPNAGQSNQRSSARIVPANVVPSEPISPIVDLPESSGNTGPTSNPQISDERQELVSVPISASGTINFDSPVEVKVEAPMIASGGATISPGGINLEHNHMASEVPEYLRTSSRLVWQIPAAIVGLFLLMGLLVWQMLGSGDSLRSLWYGEPADIAASASKTADPQKAAATGPPAALEVESPTIAKPTKPEPVTTEPATTEPETAADADVAAADGDSGAREPETTVEKDGELSQTNDNLSMDIPPSDEEPKAENADTLPSDNSIPLDISIPTDDDIAPAFQQPGLSFAPSDSEATRAAVFVVGRASSAQLLTEVQEPVVEGRVVVPPSTRTTLDLGGWHWTVGGASVVDIQLADESPELTTSLFRGILSPNDPLSALVMKTPVGDYTITPSTHEVWLGVELATRPISRGAIHEDGSYSPVLVLVAGSDNSEVSGSLATIRAHESDQEITIDRPGQGVALLPDQEMVPFTLHSPPAWYSQRSIRPIDQEASADFFAELDSSQEPLAERLASLISGNRPELAALAIQSSMMLGRWPPFASDLLNSDRLRNYWTATLDLARQLALVDRATLDQIRSQFDSNHSKDAEQLFELFVGLRHNQQATQGLQTLIKSLESDKLPIRVLSSYELGQLTGSDHGYLPHAPVRTGVQQLRKQVSSGKVAIKPVGDPIWERVAVP